MLRLTSPTAALLAALALPAMTACAEREAVPIEGWLLQRGVGEPAVISLPARLDGVLDPGTPEIVLAAELDVPPAWRGRALTLSIPLWWADAALRVDGAPATPLVTAEGDAYRPVSAHIWQLSPAQTDAERISLELRAPYSWPPAGWIDVAPMLSARPRGDPWTRFVDAFNRWSCAVALGTFLAIAFTYFVLFLAVPAQRAYIWLALQTATTVWVLLFTAGVSRFLGPGLEMLVMAANIALGLWASIHYSHSDYDVGPVSRRWWGLWAIYGVTMPLAYGDPFVTVRVLGPVVIASLVVVSIYQIHLMRRLSRRPDVPPGVVAYMWAWISIIVIMGNDGMIWLGVPELFGGLHLAGIGLMGFALLQFAALSRRHLLSQRESERLNVELRRQIAERSRQLSEALGRLAGAGSAAAAVAPGDVVDERYRVVGSLGAGAMGAVYRVERLSDRRQLAMKILTQVSDARHLARFAREAQVASEVAHPNVVSIVDIAFASSGFMYLVLELVEGGSLRELDAGRKDQAWALHVVVQIAAGLAALHDRGILHRDLKPANVLVDDPRAVRPRVAITDFGISGLTGTATGDGDARPQPEAGGDRTGTVLPVAEGPRDEPTAATQTSTPARPQGKGGRRGDSSGASDLTGTGAFMGTPMYMAPELGAGARRATFASDVFALGVIAYELLADRRAFVVPPCLEPSSYRPPPFDAVTPPLPPPATEVLARALSADPGARPTARELVRVLA